MEPVTHDKYPELNELSYRTEWEALHSLSKLSHRTGSARQVLHKLSEPVSYRTEWQILDRTIFWGFSTYSFTCPRSDLWEWEHSSSREHSEEECKRTPGYILHNHPGSVWVYIHVDMQSCLQTTFFAPTRNMVWSTAYSVFVQVCYKAGALIKRSTSLKYTSHTLCQHSAGNVDVEWGILAPSRTPGCSIFARIHNSVHATQQWFQSNWNQNGIGIIFLLREK